MSKRRQTPAGAMLAIALIALVAFAAGCGDDDSSADEGDTTVTTSSLTKAQFLKQANALCSRNALAASKELEDYAQNASSSQDSTAGSLEEVVLPALQEKIDELRALGAPQGEEAQVEDILLALERAKEQTEENSSQSFTDFGKRIVPAAETARKYGLDDCI